MSMLHLTLKKKWFDMIASGEKIEEYREIKSYWANKFLSHKRTLNPYKYVLFRNGYSSKSPEMAFEILSIEIGKAIPEWSDNWEGDCFVIKLGKQIDSTEFFINIQL